jgi:hypothetical protein
MAVEWRRSRDAVNHAIRHVQKQNDPRTAISAGVVSVMQSKQFGDEPSSEPEAIPLHFGHGCFLDKGRRAIP